MTALNDLKLIAVYEDLESRISTLKKGVSTISLTPGPQGPAGVDGKDGRDGEDGVDGRDGVDGKDGLDGSDGAAGVSVVDADVTFDKHLVLHLSDGNEIDCGSLEGIYSEADVHYHVGGGGGDTSRLTTYMDMNSKGMVAKFEAAEAITAGDLCVLDTAGAMQHADANTAVTCRTLMAVAVADIASGEIGQFLLRGFYPMAGFATGAMLWASLTPSVISDSRPTGTGKIVRVVGYAISPTEIFVDPDKTWIELQ
jgi:hypothetical protein